VGVLDRLLSPRFGHRVPAAPSTLAQLAAAAARELDANILPFWLAHARNPASGGFWGQISSDMRRRKAGPRGALLTSRILWTFAAAHRRAPNVAYLEMARYALADLTGHFLDPVDGGLYWSIDASGGPIHQHKHVYIQSFGIYGLVEYHRATGDLAALEQAKAIYLLIEAHAADRVHGGYFEAMSRDWGRRPDNLPEGIADGADKAQNSMLHVMEAYTTLLEAWPDPGLRAALVALCDHLMRFVYDPRTGHLGLYFDAAWNRTSGRYSPGHDIECSWLLTRAAQATADPALIARAREVSLALARTSLASIDAAGAMIYEAGPGAAIDMHRQWWVEAEAAIGFLDAFELSGETRFYNAAMDTWRFIERWVVDRRHGEWFGDLTRSGRVIRHSPKIGFWKCPYHNGRACMEIIERVRKLEARPIP
jgi:mannobiose 2-epimerase